MLALLAACKQSVAFGVTAWDLYVCTVHLGEGEERGQRLETRGKQVQGEPPIDSDSSLR